MAKEQLKTLLVILATIIIALISVFSNQAYLLSILLALFVLLFFVKRLDIGIYLIALLYPFIYLQLWIGEEINLPYVDLIAMFVFAAWVLKISYLWLNRKEKITLKNFPGLFFFIPFIVASSLSLINIENLGSGIKYILRPLTFFYLMFVVLPYNVVNSKKILFNIFKILYFVGIFVSLMGLWSLIFPATPGIFRRAVPISILGVNPLGTNHNLIAEVLISVIPVGLILIWQAKKEQIKKWLILGVLFMMAINLLTFSRTGWIALSLEILILGIVRYKKKIKEVLPVAIIILILFLPIMFFMYQFLSTPIVESSNMNRIQLTKIALASFKQHPIIGSGAGTFIEQVSRDKWYILDFGAPLEAHGVVQKLIAETGALGFLTFFLLLGFVLYSLIKTYFKIDPDSPWKLVILCLTLSVVGSIVFQLFNTSYYVSKLWFPIGIALAASRLALGDKKTAN